MRQDRSYAAIDHQEKRCPVSVRLPNETIAALQFVSADIRRTTGKSIRHSAIVRGLVTWLAESRVDSRDVASVDDLRRCVREALRGAAIPDASVGTSGPGSR